jgi:hypothetical protein
MSTSKTDTSGVFNAPNLQPDPARLTIPVGDVRLHKSGIEFAASCPIALWTEMTVDIDSPLDGRQVCGTGTVVACSGNSKEGYLISMVLINPSRQAREQLNRFASPSSRMV